MGLSGLEPPTSRLSGVRSNRLSYKPISSRLCYLIFHPFGCHVNKFLCLQWRLRDSNSRPPACKAGALPTELSPQLLFKPLNQCAYFEVVLYITFTVISVLVFFFLIWQPPTLPYRLQYSTIGRLGLNHRVRDENGCLP